MISQRRDPEPETQNEQPAKKETDQPVKIEIDQPAKKEPDQPAETEMIAQAAEKEIPETQDMIAETVEIDLMTEVVDLQQDMDGEEMMTDHQHQPADTTLVIPETDMILEIDMTVEKEEVILTEEVTLLIEDHLPEVPSKKITETNLLLLNNQHLSLPL
jgi:hypothetical protein